jgi:hypothetical protein
MPDVSASKPLMRPAGKKAVAMALNAPHGILPEDV